MIGSIIELISVLEARTEIVWLEMSDDELSRRSVTDEMSDIEARLDVGTMVWLTTLLDRSVEDSTIEELIPVLETTEDV